ncbi:MAG: hypothetical protein ABEJ85_00155 [Haloarculaceae archaeon]
MTARDSRWLAIVFGPLVGYWLGWMLLLPSSGVAFWTLPVYERAYVVGLLPTVLWTLATASGALPELKTEDWGVPDAVRS